MKPTAAFFLLAVLAVTLAEASVYRSDTSCQKVMMQRSIDECRPFMMFGRRPRLAMTSDTEEVPGECCQQLREVPEKCRCEMIKMTAQEMRREGFGGDECRGPCSEMMMRAKYLPAMCDVGPRSCRMKMGSSSSDAY